MKEIWVADAETDPFDGSIVPAPFIWGCYNGSEYHEFDETEKFVNFISERDCVVYAHNGGKFDWFFVLDKLEAYAPIMVISGRLSKFKIGEAEFRDSYNILPMPLSTWQKDEFDYEILKKEFRDIPENKQKIKDYLRNDCIYLYQIVAVYKKDYGDALTQAGSAMKFWEAMSEYPKPKTNKSFYESVSPYYYGGRVECFAEGIIEKDFLVVDINSAYPAAMMDFHPYGDSYSVSSSLPNTRAATERAFITLKCVSRGALPYRGKTGLTFPNDDIERVYQVSGWEFVAACDTKTIEDWEILEVMVFPDTIKFSEYIEHFYKMKDDAKERGFNDETKDWGDKKLKADYIFAKLFLNTLYGKYGSNPEKYQEYTVVKPSEIMLAEEDGYEFCAELDKWALCSRDLTEDQEKYYNVAVAASITGSVRAKMWRAINECNEVMYCDTDSIACTNTNGLELNPTKLGAWDIEAHCDYGGIAGKKMYAFRTVVGKWKTACKGVRLSPEEIIEVAKGTTVRYNPIGPSFSLKRGISFIPRNVNKNTCIEKK